MDLAVASWIAGPLVAVHVMARRRRALLVFQVIVDVLLLALPGRLLLSGAHLGPGYGGGETWGAPAPVGGSTEQSDLPLQFAVWWDEARRLAAAGDPPWVSDRIGGGAPLFAHGQAGLPFPLQVPVWLLGVERGTDVMAVWKLELAALGAFVLLRRLRLRPAAAAVGGLAFAFGLYPLSWLVVPLSWVVAAAPWAWWALIGCLRGRRSNAAGLAVLMGALAGWSVHPETAAFLWLSVAAAGGVLAWGRWRRVQRLAVPFGLALAISGIGALPTLAAVADSEKLAAARAGPLYPTEGIDGAMRGRALALLAVPWRDGHPADGTWRWPFPAAALELGVGAAAVTLLLAGRPVRRLARHRLALAITGGAAAILVWQAPPLARVLAHIPVLGVMTWSRAGFLIGFAVAMSAAAALDGALRRPHRRRIAAAAIVVQVTIVMLGLTAPPGVDRFHLWGAAWAPLASGATCLVGGPVGGWAVATVVAAESTIAGWGLLPASRPAGKHAPIAVELRRRLDEEGGRVLGLGSALPPNLAARWGAADLRAHDPVRPLSLARLHRALGSAGSDLPGPVTTPWAGLAGAWGVRWLVTPGTGLEGPAAADWVEVYRDDDGRIYRNPRALPTVRLASQAVRPPGDARAADWERIDFVSTVVTGDAVAVAGGGRLRILGQRPWRVLVDAETGAASMVVVHSPRAQGWQARVDGLPAPLADVNLGAMGIAVPAGRHEVSLTYSPPGLAPGAVLTAIGLACAGWLAVRRRR